MSNSNLVNVRVPAHLSNYSQGRSGRKIEIITIHHMAGILSAKNCGSIFQRVGKGASAHYGVGKNGEIGHMLMKLIQLGLIQIGIVTVKQ